MLRCCALLLARPRCGIIGLPNVGKSTLFNALTDAKGETGNMPFVTIKPNMGHVVVQDERLDRIGELPPHKKAKRLRNKVDIWDVAGLVRGASEGQGLGNQFLANIRECHALLHMVRCHDDKSITHIEGETDPLRDIAIINNELALADLQSLQKQRGKVVKGGVGQIKSEVLERCEEWLLQERMVYDLKEMLSPEEWMVVQKANLLTSREMIYVCNVDEETAAGATCRHVEQVKEKFGGKHAICLISAVIEQEAAELGEEEGRELLNEFGLKSSQSAPLTAAILDALNLSTYFTAGPIEVRAWTCPRECTAREASESIHSEFPMRLTKVDVTSYDDYIASGGDGSRAQTVDGSHKVANGDILYFHIDQKAKIKK